MPPVRQEHDKPRTGVDPQWAACKRYRDRHRWKKPLRLDFPLDFEQQQRQQQQLDSNSDQHIVLKQPRSGAMVLQRMSPSSSGGAKGLEKIGPCRYSSQRQSLCKWSLDGKDNQVEDTVDARRPLQLWIYRLDSRSYHQ